MSGSLCQSEVACGENHNRALKSKYPTPICLTTKSRVKQLQIRVYGGEGKWENDIVGQLCTQIIFQREIAKEQILQTFQRRIDSK